MIHMTQLTIVFAEPLHGKWQNIVLSNWTVSQWVNGSIHPKNSKNMKITETIFDLP